MFLPYLEHMFWTVITKHQSAIETFANINIYLATLVVAVSPTMAKESVLMYVMYLIGHIIWTTVLLLIIKQKRLLYLNAGFILLDIYAIIVRM